MTRFTISISEELKKRLDALPDINWPEIAKQGVIEKLSELEKFEKLKEQGEL